MADENKDEGGEGEGQNPPAPEVKTEDQMTTEELTALHADEDFIANFTEDDKKDPEKVTALNEAILRSAQTTVHQKRHYRELAKAEKPPKKDETPAPKPTEKDKKDEKKVDPQVATDFRLDHPELSKAQQLKVIAHAGAYGIGPEDALKDPLMVQFIKSTNTAEDVDDASPAPGRRAGGAIGDRDWSNATPAEMDAARAKILHPNG